MKNRNNKKGFTLVEVLVVVLIIGILAAIAVPSYNFTVEKTRAKQGIISLTQIAKAQYTYNAKKGNYSDNMFNLPLDMKDSDGSDVTGAEFADKFFDYKIFGDEFERARATRNTGEYELSVEYETGQLFCRPIEHKVCQDLNLEEGEELISWPQKTGCDPAEYGYSSSYYNCYRVLYKDGTKMDTICSINNPQCYVYNNDGNLTQHFFMNPSLVNIYDPNTGKKIARIDYNADGSFNRYIEYKDGIPTRGIDTVGGVNRLIDYDGSASDYYLIRNNKITRWENYTQQKYTQYYDSEGRLSRVYFHPKSGVEAQVNYDTNGEISFFVCKSGDCENWTPPEMSSFKYQTFPEIPEMNNNSCLEDNPDNPMVCGAS